MCFWLHSLIQLSNQWGETFLSHKSSWATCSPCALKLLIYVCSSVAIKTTILGVQISAVSTIILTTSGDRKVDFPKHKCTGPPLQSLHQIDQCIILVSNIKNILWKLPTIPWTTYTSHISDELIMEYIMLTNYSYMELLWAMWYIDLVCSIQYVAIITLS